MIQHPTWLTTKFLGRVLNSFPDDVIAITKYEVEPAVPVGENYFSVILRVRVHFKRSPEHEEESISLITKSMPEGILSEILTAINTMGKELSLYRSILPQIENLIRFPVSPSSYCCSHEDIVILEDLRTEGYKMADRVKQLDYEHCVKALVSLAKFHAASVVLFDRDPDLFKTVGEETVYPHSETQKPFVENAFKLLADEVERWPGVEDFAPRLRRAAETIFETVGEAVKAVPSTVNVLNHGDFWSNNLLYSYDVEGSLTDVRLIDWQLCRWTTPAMDLQMFFYSSVGDLSSMDQLTKIYLASFNEMLSELGSQRKLSDEQLEEDLRRTDCYGLLVAVSLLPICVGTRGEHLDFTETTLDDFSTGFVKSNPYAPIYRGLKYKKIIPGILKSFGSKNLL